MTLDSTPAPRDRSQRAGSGPRDPLRMTEAEKRAAEWEARHDVAARGRRSAPDVVQHYLAHERIVESRGPVARPQPPRDDAGTGPRAAGEPATGTPALGHGRLRRLLGRLRRDRG